MKTVAYLRVSTRSQDLANQKLAILEFSQKRLFPIDRFIESRISSRHSPLERRIDEMLGTLQPSCKPRPVLRAQLSGEETIVRVFFDDPPTGRLIVPFGERKGPVEALRSGPVRACGQERLAFKRE